MAGGDGSLAAVLDRSAADAGRSRTTGPRLEVIRVKYRLGHVLGIVLGHAEIRVALADLQGGYDVEHTSVTEP